MNNRDVKLCSRAGDSLRRALEKVHRQQSERLKSDLQELIERLRRREPLSNKTSVAEGSLPNGARFYALKKLPLRCYYWIENDTIFISHFVFKDYQKLRDDERHRVHECWREFNPIEQRQRR